MFCLQRSSSSIFEGVLGCLWIDGGGPKWLRVGVGGQSLCSLGLEKDLASFSFRSSHLIGSKQTSFSFCEHMMVRVDEGGALQAGTRDVVDTLKTLLESTSSPSNRSPV